MIAADIHTHTTFSCDGRSTIDEMAARARELGLTYYGISEHFNYDYDRLHLTIDGEAVPPIDAAAYFARARALQKENEGKLHILVGAEFGFDHDSRVQERYCETARRFKPDFIINSIHTCLGMDCYFPHYSEGRSKAFAYNAYLYRVLESLDAAYPYDVVAHLGYCARNAVYPDPKLRYADFADVLDEILRRIVARGKILEVNTSAKTAGSPFIPDVDILARYYELGGREVSFASDAHDITRIGEKYELVTDALRKIGSKKKPPVGYLSGRPPPCYWRPPHPRARAAKRRAAALLYHILRFLAARMCQSFFCSAASLASPAGSALTASSLATLASSLFLCSSSTAARTVVSIWAPTSVMTMTVA